MELLQSQNISLGLIDKNEGQISGLPANPRVLSEDNFKKLKESLEDAPAMLSLRELLVYPLNGRYVVIGGNMRLEALRRLGYAEAPCKVIPETASVDFLRAVVLRDNSSYGDWDWNILANEFTDLELQAAAINFPMDWNLEEETPVDDSTAEDDDFDEDSEEIEERVHRGDVWQLGDHRLMCGDATIKEDVEKLRNGADIDLWMTDPPYNVDYQGGTEDKLKIENDKMESAAFREFLTKAFKNATEHLKPGRPFYMWFGSANHVDFELALRETDVHISEELVWVKNSLILGRFDYQYRYEVCLYGWRNGSAHKWYSDRKQSNVLEFDKPKRSDLHPTMKPIPLISYQIKNSSIPGDMVLDTFGGSGTTLICCEQLGRKCLTMELTEHYASVIVARWEKLTGKQAVKIN